MGEHLGPRNISEKWDRSTSPGMNVEVLAFCSTCEKCQQTCLLSSSPFPSSACRLRESAWISLSRLRSQPGANEYILVIMDYTTCLCNARNTEQLYKILMIFNISTTNDIIHSSTWDELVVPQNLDNLSLRQTLWAQILLGGGSELRGATVESQAQ